jgi:hypothetical protein
MEMKVEIDLDALERKSIVAFKEYNRTFDRIDLGFAYAYARLLANLVGRNEHTLIEKLSTRAEEEARQCKLS